MSLIRAWWGTPANPRIVEVELEQPEPHTCERRTCQRALEEVIAAKGITGVPLDSAGLPHIIGIEAVR